MTDRPTLLLTDFLDSGPSLLDHDLDCTVCFCRLVIFVPPPLFESCDKADSFLLLNGRSKRSEVCRCSGAFYCATSLSSKTFWLLVRAAPIWSVASGSRKGRPRVSVNCDCHFGECTEQDRSAVSNICGPGIPFVEGVNQFSHFRKRVSDTCSPASLFDIPITSRMVWS